MSCTHTGAGRSARHLIGNLSAFLNIFCLCVCPASLLVVCPPFGNAPITEVTVGGWCSYLLTTNDWFSDWFSSDRWLGSAYIRSNWWDHRSQSFSRVSKCRHGTREKSMLFLSENWVGTRKAVKTGNSIQNERLNTQVKGYTKKEHTPRAAVTHKGTRWSGTRGRGNTARGLITSRQRCVRHKEGNTWREDDPETKTYQNKTRSWTNCRSCIGLSGNSDYLSYYERKYFLLKVHAAGFEHSEVINQNS